MMWKYKDLTLIYEGKKTTNLETGEETYEGRIEESVKGIIVPISAEDTAKGFQIGSFACYCSLPWKPTIGTCFIQHDDDIFHITKVEYWEEKDLYVLEIRL